MNEGLFKVSAPPHISIRDGHTSTIMQDVILALMPALMAGIFYFGYRAMVITLLSILSAMFFEYLWNKIFRMPCTLRDCSAIVSGLILAFSMPATVPLWMPVVGSFFMIIIVKMCFGGLGQNFMNPAMGARAFLMASWPASMVLFESTYKKLPLFIGNDAISTATPLQMLKAGATNLPSILDLFVGNVGGCIGETSVIALLLGGAYLLIRRVITLRIPIAYIGTVAVLTYIFGGETLFSGNFIYHILSGGLIFGAFFIATDYTTSPITPMGQIIYGIGCGVMTVIIRLIGGYPEGVCYSVLLMNILTPFIEKITYPRRFGKKVRKNA